MKNQKVANSFEDVQARFKAMEEQEQAKQRRSRNCDQEGLQFRLANIREELHLSPEVFARKIGCTTRTLGKYERGESKPNYEKLCKYAKIGNVSLEFLFGRADNSILDENLFNLIKQLPKEKKEAFIQLLK